MNDDAGAPGLSVAQILLGQPRDERSPIWIGGVIFYSGNNFKFGVGLKHLTEPVTRNIFGTKQQDAWHITLSKLTCAVCGGAPKIVGLLGNDNVSRQLREMIKSCQIDSAGCAGKTALCELGLGERNGEVNQDFPGGLIVGWTVFLNRR